jgi:hypothetical protein
MASGMPAGAQQVVVLEESGPHGVGVLLPEAGAPLDVREEEGDRRSLTESPGEM